MTNASKSKLYDRKKEQKPECGGTSSSCIFHMNEESQLLFFPLSLEPEIDLGLEMFFELVPKLSAVS